MGSNYIGCTVMKTLSRRMWAEEEKLGGTAGRMSYWEQEQVKRWETS